MSKQKMIEMMQDCGYYYDEIDSHATWLVFNGIYCGKLWFDSWNDVEEWLNEYYD